MKKILFSILTFSFLTLPVLADDATLTTNPVMTAMPSLTIAPDGRAAAMGDVGVATNADLNSQHWNPAKYAFIQDDFSVGLAYSPWLRELVTDMNIAYLGISKRVSPKSTVFRISKLPSEAKTGFSYIFPTTAKIEHVPQFDK